MKKLTDKDAILCKNIEEAIAIRDKFGLDIDNENIARGFKNHGQILLHKDNLLSNKRYAKENGFKITKASKILNSKKELLQRIKKLENVMIDNTEVTVSKTPEIDGIKNELTELPEKWCVKDNETVTNWVCEQKPSWGKGVSEMYFHNAKDKNILEYGFQEEILEGYTEITFEEFKKWVLKEDNLKPVESDTFKKLSIREVQVKVNSQEEANECAEIAKDCGEKVGNIIVYENFNIFRLDVYCDSFFVSSIKKVKCPEISIQELRDSFGKPKEIDWSKVGEKVTNGYIVVMIMEYSNRTNKGNFRGLCIHRFPEKMTDDEVGNYSNNWIKDDFKLCTEPITLSN